MGRVLKYVLLAVVLVPIASIGFLLGSYFWDSYQAGRVVRAQLEAISLGDTRGEVEEIVAAADASAGNQPFGHYMLAQAGLWSGSERMTDDSWWSIRGFWLRTGISCYLEFQVKDGVVSQLDDVYCEDDGWFE